MIHRKLFKGFLGLGLAALFFFIPLLVSAQSIQGIYLPLVKIAGTAPQPTPHPDGVYILDNSTTFIDPGGEQHFVGEVFNNTDELLQLVEITVNLYDAQDQLLTTGAAYTPMFTLPARARTCFDVALVPPAGTVRYAFAAPAYFTGGAAIPPMSLLNSAWAYDPASGGYGLSGQVRSDYSGTAKFVQSIGTLTNAQRQVLGCGFAFVDSTDLASGQISPFEITFSGRDYADVTGYRLQVDGNP
jgi:hypothetical protein